MAPKVHGELVQVTLQTGCYPRSCFGIVVLETSTLSFMVWQQVTAFVLLSVGSGSELIGALWSIHSSYAINIVLNM